ncbi:heat shock protein Hsp18 [Sporomusa termitida]|uniref:18 kDa heat shock protein n=1 Tax=Sporomusa termitida TaxID=2377 RepID=A0A517DY24_9FIRM|nr:heat shock protein Hsp18 [Sporomusa termitida]QDR82261.1 18 kDa heat shock protein [Sporomusa termitida]
MFDLVPFRKNSNNLVKRGDYFNQLVENFFNEDFFAPLTHNGGQSFQVDLTETEDAYLIDADLPGINKESIEVDYANNYLTIAAKREDVVENKTGSYVRRERKYGEFRRAFFIDNVRQDGIEAAFDNGVLKTTLPKETKKAGQPSRIEIK